MGLSSRRPRRHLLLMVAPVGSVLPVPPLRKPALAGCLADIGFPSQVLTPRHRHVHRTASRPDSVWFGTTARLTVSSRVAPLRLAVAS